MNLQSETINKLSELHAEFRRFLEDNIPDSYAKKDALFNLDMAFDGAKEAVNESSGSVSTGDSTPPLE